MVCTPCACVCVCARDSVCATVFVCAYACVWERKRERKTIAVKASSVRFAHPNLVQLPVLVNLFLVGCGDAPCLPSTQAMLLVMPQHTHQVRVRQGTPHTVDASWAHLTSLSQEHERCIALKGVEVRGLKTLTRETDGWPLAVTNGAAVASLRHVKTEVEPTSIKTPYLPLCSPSLAMPGQSLSPSAM